MACRPQVCPECAERVSASSLLDLARAVSRPARASTARPAAARPAPGALPHSLSQALRPVTAPGLARSAAYHDPNKPAQQQQQQLQWQQHWPSNTALPASSRPPAARRRSESPPHLHVPNTEFGYTPGPITAPAFSSSAGGPRAPSPSRSMTRHMSHSQYSMYAPSPVSSGQKPRAAARGAVAGYQDGPAGLPGALLPCDASPHPHALPSQLVQADNATAATARADGWAEQQVDVEAWVGSVAAAASSPSEPHSHASPAHASLATPATSQQQLQQQKQQQASKAQASPTPAQAPLSLTTIREEFSALALPEAAHPSPLPPQQQQQQQQTYSPTSTSTAPPPKPSSPYHTTGYRGTSGAGGSSPQARGSAAGGAGAATKRPPSRERAPGGGPSASRSHHDSGELPSNLLNSTTSSVRNTPMGGSGPAYLSNDDLRTLKELNEAYNQAEQTTQQLLAQAQEVLSQPVQARLGAYAGASSTASPSSPAGAGSLRGGEAGAGGGGGTGGAGPGSRPQSAHGAAGAGAAGAGGRGGGISALAMRLGHTGAATASRPPSSRASGGKPGGSSSLSGSGKDLGGSVQPAAKAGAGSSRGAAVQAAGGRAAPPAQGGVKGPPLTSAEQELLSEALMEGGDS